MPSASVEPRHIQDYDAATSEIPHWGYATRVWPCNNDPGTCAYLDAVYWMHDVSMLYTFILWAVIGGVLLIFLAIRIARPREPARQKHELENQEARGVSSYTRVWGAVAASCRRVLLPESFVSFFGHITRLQILLLSGILLYLLIFSFIGMVYKTWVTPIDDTPYHNTRTTLGGFADRIGAIAYALTPLTVALSTRENLLSLITGIPYQHLNFLHRWTGRIIFVQSFLHTLFWTIIEGRLYEPQPKVFTEWIAQMYMVFGVVAQILITFLYLFSIKRVVKYTGHEFFRKTHYVAGILYLGACWAHWTGLACWMIASIGILFLDRGCRLLRTLLMHFKLKDSDKGFGFRPAYGLLTSFPDGENGTVVRLEFTHRHLPWKPGQHFFLCFPELSVWQSHPFTPVTVGNHHSSEQRHVYVMRCLAGETARLANLAAKSVDPPTLTPVILTGPFGGAVIDRNAPNVLAIAGGTGISFALPIVTAAMREVGSRRVELVWIIRHTRNTEWVEDELESLLSASETVLDKTVTVRVYITREERDSSSSVILNAKEEVAAGKETAILAPPRLTISRNNLQIEYLANHHPDMNEVVQRFIHDDSSPSSYGRAQVLASGPAAMGGDLRTAVAKANNGAEVWKGRTRYDVGLYGIIGSFERKCHIDTACT